MIITVITDSTNTNTNTNTSPRRQPAGRRLQPAAAAVLRSIHIACSHHGPHIFCSHQSYLEKSCKSAFLKLILSGGPFKPSQEKMCGDWAVFYHSYSCAALIYEVR